MAFGILNFVFSILNFNFGPKVGERALKQLGYTGTLWTAWGADFLRAQWVWQSSMSPNHGSSHHMLPRPFPPPFKYYCNCRSGLVQGNVQLLLCGDRIEFCWNSKRITQYINKTDTSPLHVFDWGEGNYHKKINNNNNKQNNKIFFFYLNAN